MEAGETPKVQASSCQAGDVFANTADNPNHGYHRALECIQQLESTDPTSRYDLRVTFVREPDSSPPDYTRSFFEVVRRDSELLYQPQISTSAYFGCYNNFGSPVTGGRRDIEVEAKTGEIVDQLRERLTTEAHIAGEKIAAGSGAYCVRAQLHQFGPSPLQTAFADNESGTITLTAVFLPTPKRGRALTDYKPRSAMISIPFKTGEDEIDTARRLLQAAGNAKKPDEDFKNFVNLTGAQNRAIQQARESE